MPQLALLNKPPTFFLILVLLTGTFTAAGPPGARAAAKPGDTQFTGQLLPDLVPNTDDLDLYSFKPFKQDSAIKLATPLPVGAQVTAGGLYNAQTDQTSIAALLVETGNDPVLYADLDMNGMIADNERFTFKREEADNPYVWIVTVNVPLTGSFFHSVPLYVQYLKDVQEAAGVSADERVIQQSKSAIAQGVVDVKGRKIDVEYGFNARAKKITPEHGFLGVDGNGDGKIETGRFASESTESSDETVVFRAGDTYLSTSQVDLEKNRITMLEHPASDYTRIEVRMGGELPDFAFTDLNGKKRKLSEFRGKFLLVDFWGYWCPACREQLPFLKEAYARFSSRNFEILGMDSDDDVDGLKSLLLRNQLLWTQAQLLSIKDEVLGLRVHFWPTQILLDPNGKIISLNEHNQPSLHGRKLLESLDKLLPR